jgi:hypothetical protein
MGQGPRSILLVGGPHPNEPIGCLTVLELITHFLAEPQALAGTGFRWAFVPCIEPDALMLNAGWLKGPRTPEDYLAHFYRPRFDRQAEYTFPLDVPGWRFDHPTPENLAWRAALERVRPDVLVSLHNAEFGGVFYLVSRALPGLADRLAAEPVAAGLNINTFGDPGLEVETLRPGVSLFEDIAAGARKALGAGRPGNASWPAGQSSAGYASERFGTFSLVMEAPYWDDPRLRDTSLSDVTLGEAYMTAAGPKAAAVRRLRDELPILRPLTPKEGAPFLGALEETLAAGEGRPEDMGALGARRLTVGEALLLKSSLGLFTLRPTAHLARLNDACGRPGEAQALREEMFDAVKGLRKTTAFNVIPLKTLVDLQIKAVLTTTAALMTVAKV